MGRRAALGIATAIVAALWCTPAPAFQLDGHEVIEATAYKRLLALDVVPGTGEPGVSGRALLASLIATGVLDPPPCFDGAKPRGDCDPSKRLELPIGHWPLLGSGGPDLVLDRQLGQRGQCQHFMARTSDGLSPVDARFGVPGALASDAYVRCVRVAGSVFELILRDPLLAHWRMAGTYVLVHAIEDSFSAAHVERDPHFKIQYLLSWTLIDWPRYTLRGQLSFPPATHHAVSDHRDDDYLLWDGRAPDGRPCGSFLHPYAVPESCLTERAKAAADAVVAFLVLTYQVRARASAESRPASLFSSSSDDERTAWLAFLRDHVASVAAAAELPAEPQSPLPRPDLFLGVQGVAGLSTWGVGAWGARLFFVKPVVPFVLGISGTAGFGRREGARHVAGGTGLSLLLPLIRRFTVGASPAGLRLTCNTSFGACALDVTAVLGEMLIPVGDSTWIGVVGPTWSWTERALDGSWFGLSVGWTHETSSRREPPGPAAIASWDPPRPDQVRAYRLSRSTRAIYLAATAVSQPENTYVGIGIDWRRDHDVWNRRAGVSPGVQVEVDQGTIEGARRRSAVAVAPTARAYLVANRLALTATPALVRVGAFGDRAVGVDVAARAGFSFNVGGIEVDLDSPPMSYVSTSRWHSFPMTVRLGALLD